MAFVNELPIWALALMIFLLRIVDMSLCTLRTLAIVEQRTLFSMLVGFWEVLVWLLAVAQVLGRVNESLVLAAAYAGGFAAGNAVGIWLEQLLAHGTVVLRIVSSRGGERIARALRRQGQVLTSFSGEGRDGAVSLIYVTCARRRLPHLLEAAQAIDPELFFVVERAQGSGHGAPSQRPRWRTAFTRR